MSASLAPAPPKPRRLDRVRQALRVRHYSLRTEQAYGAGITRYLRFHGGRGVRSPLDGLG